MQFKNTPLLAAFMALFFSINAQSNRIPVTVHFEKKIGTAVFGPDEMAAIAANLNLPVASVSGQDIVLMLPAGGSFLIKPKLNERPKNGATTFDIVETRKHILGITAFSSPYQLFAADANHDDTVSTTDMVLMSKVSLGVLPGFPINASWRFLDAGFVFDSIKNPLKQGCPESIEIKNLKGPLTVHFVAVKIGDVNRPANLLIGPPLRPDFKMGLPLQFWPSPTTGTVNFQFKLQKAETAQLEILTETGDPVIVQERHFEAGPNTWQVDLAKLRAGPYFANISTATRKAVIKIQKS